MTREDVAFYGCILIALYLLWHNARANHQARRAKADAKLAALVVAALDDVDDYPASDTPIHDDLATARLRRQLDQWGAGA